MYRRFIATVTAASIAITAFGALPARADNNNDAARALAALLGIAIVGKIIHDNKKDKEVRRHPKKVDRYPHKQYGHIEQRPRNRVQRHDRWDLQPRPLPRRVNRKLLPGKCFNSHQTRNGRVQMFGRNCLENNYRHVDRLPRQCFTKIRTRHGKRRGYEARCLRDRGYSLARR